ncbi:MAG: LamG domain-containing protein, partial [Patescibacteria group bacterium]
MKNFKYLPLLAGAVMLLGADRAFAAVNDYTNYYTFDEGTGRTVGDIAGGQNGVLTGTSTGFGWASGMIGTALGMDGVSGESVALPDGFLNGTQGSIAVWIKLNILSGRNIIFSGRSASDNYIYAALMVDHEGRPELAFRTTTDGNDRKAQGTKILNKNEWYQFVLVATGGTYRMFINGEEVSVAGDNVGKWFPDLTNRTFIYRVGALDVNPLTGVFDGYLDDLRIYARALTTDDVVTLYNGGKPGTPDMPLAAKQAAVQSNVVVTEVTLSSMATS